MGLLGSSDSGGPAESLASGARGSTVTANRLTATSGSRLGQSHLDDKPLIELLHEGEQPQYYFYNPNQGLSRDDNTIGDDMTSGYRTICLVTSQRVLLITKGNTGAALEYGLIEDVETSSGLTKNRLSVFTQDHEYVMYIASKMDFDEIAEAGDYINQKAAEASSDNGQIAAIENFRQPWQSSSADRSADEAIATNTVGSYVTQDRFNKINDILDPDEVVHYITRGTTVDVEGSSAGTSLFGDDRSRKTGTKGYVRAVITDRRVAIKVPQVLGNDERSVPYDSITSADLDTGLINKRITLQTPGQTYHIEAQEPGKEEVREAVRFIREKRSEANQPDVVTTNESSESDPLDQLEKLRELHEKGAVSDSEFENKKADLLDQI